MKTVVTLSRLNNPKDKIKVVIETDIQDINCVTAEGYEVTKVEEINPTVLHMFFGSATVRALDDYGVAKAVKECKKGNGEMKIVNFCTEAEKDAYLQGIEDSMGWEDCVAIENYLIEEEVPNAIKEFEKKMSK